MQSRKRLFVQSVPLPPLVLVLFTRMRLRCAHVHVHVLVLHRFPLQTQSEKLIEQMYCVFLDIALLNLYFICFRFCH